jgi:hypothetical protein
VDIDDRSALRRCVATEPGLFAAEHWSERALLSAAEDLPAGFEDLFSLAAVDELVSRRGLRTPFLRIAKDGQVVDPARFTRSGGAGAEVRDQVWDDRVLALFADGCTLVLQGLHRVWPPLIDFASALAADLGHPVQVNAYVTPPQSRGFSAHYDVHDVFVLQVAGEKRWMIHPPVLARPLRDQPWTNNRQAVADAAGDQPVIDTVLRAGDALYLPRGWLHSAEALGATSVHLTVGVHPVTRYAVLEALTTLAAQDAQLRRSLPLGLDLGDTGDTGEMAAQVEETVQALVAWLGRADPATVGERVRRQVWSAVRPAPVAPVAQAALASSLAPTTRVRLRPHLRHVLREEGDDLALVLTDRTIRFPATTRGALDAALSGVPVAVGDLPGLDAEEQVTVAGRLLREAVVVPADA